MRNRLDDDNRADNNGVTITGCSKSYLVDQREVPVLRDVTLNIEPGEFFCFVGGSGCGKSTLLKMIVGLEQPTTGTITMGDRQISGPGLDRGMVFQDHRLLPWLTVRQNIDFGLREGVATNREQNIDEHIQLVGLCGFENAYPRQLSGGMAQRVGLARALVNRPQVLLLDEPLGALDALTRQQMQHEILRIWKAEKTTMVLVTHDIDEAIFLADRIAVIGNRPGEVREVVSVDLPRPRDRGDRRFDALRKQLWDSIFHPTSTTESEEPPKSNPSNVSQSDETSAHPCEIH
ncbi:ABC transporter ATP-binding protein [Blastopirellula retiformator]|uniref:Aliphatic sulfonates import ATP-binding protein SsuB n=1 Tax=Blastopirellula retiformator TaxID=2527970 RepID=A0A5C5V9P3_9BACT|nr:ABC transporter ATP-binding protein [Blastopirellula retiformator]TWT34415.1 Aliphatic sulfonates import ATP-binding protein SsuB [Blastopirellula retiformator]